MLSRIIHVFKQCPRESYHQSGFYMTQRFRSLLVCTSILFLLLDTVACFLLVATPLQHYKTRAHPIGGTAFYPLAHGVSAQSSSPSMASSSSNPMSDFQRRMLERVKKEEARERREKGFIGNKENSSSITGTPLNFHIVHTLEQFKRIIVDDYKDKIRVVRFFAPWCKVCKFFF